MPGINDFTLQIATINGSGSQSANNILVRSLFRCGLPVAGKNLFPSNIQGSPTWFSIRISEKGYLSRSTESHIVVAMNPATFLKDLASVTPQGVFIYNSDQKVSLDSLRSDITPVGVPFTQLSQDLSSSTQLKKLLVNMVYVGILGELIDLPMDTIEAVIHDQFSDKPKVIETNLQALRVGRTYVQENLSFLKDHFPYKVSPLSNGNKNKILIDGNTATGLGLVYGGCNFMAWYPITPSSSVPESFTHFAHEHRKDKDGKNTFAIIQAEDELSAIAMVLGSGWAGGRAITCTSGPGVSLMGEAAGLSYFAEIPAVIWNVQRGGPSTGLPTRTQQSDVLSSAFLSHGDCEHILLFPGNPTECFEFGQICFDLADRLQTLVLVLSDLDVGMNFWATEELKPLDSFDRGKIMTASDLDKTPHYGRYKDLDGDGIPYRTLPGTEHPLAPYMTRGTGHTEMAQYSEDNEAYRKLLTRLKKKFETSKKYVPAPIICNDDKEASIGLVFYGSTTACIQEVQDELKQKGLSSHSMRIRAYPFSQDVIDYIHRYERIYLIEQNRDAQLKTLLLKDYPEFGDKIRSVLQYDGLPIAASYVINEVYHLEGVAL